MNLSNSSGGDDLTSGDSLFNIMGSEERFILG
jgi:hypothetical protein